MTDKPQPAEQHLEKQSQKTDKALEGSQIKTKDDNAIQQKSQIRDAIRSARITTNPDNPLQIDMGGGKFEQDRRALPGKNPQQAYKEAGYGDPGEAGSCVPFLF